MKKLLLYCAILCMLFFVNKSNAQSVRIRLPDTTGLSIGSIVEIPVYVDSILTGKNVTSYQLSILFSGAVSSFTFLDITTTGTISAGFGVPTYSMGNYQPTPSYKLLQIAAAGTSPLVGKGKLFNIRMRIINSGSIYSQFLSNSTCFFNQGSPSLNLINGNWTITPNPTLSINLNGISPLTIGDSVNVYVYGGQAPYQLSVINGNIASFRLNSQQGNSYYFIKGINAGKSKIRIVDANNNIDTSDLDLEVVANKITINDTTVLPQNFITIPIKINSVTGRSVLSGSFAFTYSSNLKVDSILLGNTILNNSNVQWNNVKGSYENTFYLSFANSTPLVGAGDLLKIRFKVLNTSNTYINFLNASFNQSNTLAIKNGYISFLSIPQINLFPNGLQMVAGDSVKLNVSGGRKPYQLNVNNTNFAIIDTANYLRAKSSGNVIVSVTDSLGTIYNSNQFEIFDANLTLPNLSTLPNSWVELPIFISKLPAGKNINSYQLQFNINELQVDSLIIINANTLSQNFSLISNYSNNLLNVVAAGTNAISQSGILFKIKFKLKPTLVVGNTIYTYLNSQLYNEGNVKFKDNSYGVINIVSQLQKDVRVESILNLSSSCSKSANESLTVRLNNLGNYNYFVGDKIKIGYKINNSNIVYDTILLTNNFNTNNRLDYTFKSKINLSSAIQYTIKCFTELLGDINTSNDTSTITFQVFGSPNLKLQNDTSICNGNSVTLSSNLIGTYLWSNGSTSNSITINTSGTYSLTYTNQFNCTARDTVVVTVLPSQNTPIIIATGSLNICEGDSVELSTTTSGNIQWLRNGIAIPSATYQSIVVKASGNYSVRISSLGFCDAISNPVTVNVFTKPLKPLITSSTNDSLCNGTNATLQSTFSGNAKWFRNGVEIPNATGTSYIASLPGAYTLKVTNSSNCEAESDTFRLYYFNNPDTAIIISDKISVCIGDTLSLSSDILPSSDFNLTWYLNNTAIPNSNNQSIKVVIGGAYKLIITNNFGCVSISNILNIDFNQNPVTPLITQVGNILSTTQASKYQWFLNDTIIVGANQQNFSITTSGLYKVEVKNQFDCSAVSEVFNANFVGVDLSKKQFEIYPNPAKEYLIIKSSTNYSDFNLEIHDVFGRLVIMESIIKEDQIIDISSISSGTYIVSANQKRFTFIKL